jgi:hypothetical protein
MDVSGIGDSRPPPGAPENIVYTDHATDDIAAGMRFLQGLPGVIEVHAIGLCSGGYNAFKAAVAGLPLAGVVLINPLTFFYKPGMSLDPLAPHEIAHDAQRYSRRLRSLDGWKKLVRGEVHLGRAAQVMSRLARNAAQARARGVARLLGVRLGDDLAFELESITKRKIALQFVFAGGDPGVRMLREQGGATAEKLRRRGQLGIQTIDGPNHTFTPLWSHAPLIAALAKLLDGPPKTVALEDGPMNSLANL